MVDAIVIRTNSTSHQHITKLLLWILWQSTLQGTIICCKLFVIFDGMCEEFVDSSQFLKRHTWDCQQPPTLPLVPTEKIWGEISRWTTGFFGKPSKLWLFYLDDSVSSEWLSITPHINISQHFVQLPIATSLQTLSISGIVTLVHQLMNEIILNYWISYFLLPFWAHQLHSIMPSWNGVQHGNHIQLKFVSLCNTLLGYDSNRPTDTGAYWSKDTHRAYCQQFPAQQSAIDRLISIHYQDFNKLWHMIHQYDHLLVVGNEVVGLILENENTKSVMDKYIPCHPYPGIRGLPSHTIHFVCTSTPSVKMHSVVYSLMVLWCPFCGVLCTVKNLIQLEHQTSKCIDARESTSDSY